MIEKIENLRPNLDVLKASETFAIAKFLKSEKSTSVSLAGVELVSARVFPRTGPPPETRSRD